MGHEGRGRGRDWADLAQKNFPVVALCGKVTTKSLSNYRFETIGWHS